MEKSQLSPAGFRERKPCFALESQLAEGTKKLAGVDECFGVQTVNNQQPADDLRRCQ